MSKPWHPEEIRENMTEEQQQAIKVIANILKHDEFFGSYEDMVKVIEWDLLGHERMLETKREINNKYEGEYGSQF